MAKKMLIDATHLEETRVVVADGNKVDEFDFESINKRQLAGNIYLAKITRVEPSLQAAFVDYGGNRHGFLAFSEIHPDYYQIPVADRKALLAEEAAEQERAEAREEGGGEKEKPKTRSTRGRRRARGAKTESPAETKDVSGLEVIELADEKIDADPDEPGAEPAAFEIKGLEITEMPDSDTGDGDPGDSGPGGDPAQTSSDDAAPEGDAEPAPKPGSVAESAGLHDEDSVSEDVAEAAPKADEVTPKADETEEKPAPKAKPARKRATKRKPKAAAAKDAEAAAAEEPAAGATETSESAGDAPASDAAAEPPATETEPPEAGAEAKKPASTRRRRSRAAEPDEAAEAVEVVESAGLDDTQEEAAKARAKRRSHYKIQDVVKVRQIMLVQVVKEERGNKGAALTTYLSLAGRYCVLMPNTARGGGISRKITSAGDRKRLRDITDELDVPNGMGLIVRTAGAERTRPEIKRDYEFLIRQWEQIRDLTLKSIAPALIYEEGSLIKRSIRDLYSNQIDAILVEGEEGFREAKDYMKMLMPSHARNVQRYDEQIPLYIRYQVESYLNAMFNPTVQLRSGGYIVIGVTEALVAIDVNSGRSTKESSIEETALKTNLEAAEEVARQLRLRDLAGLIVIDFIDMDDNRNNRAVEKRMKDRLKSDRARIQVGRISAFGLMEMSRQRLRPGMIEATTKPCPHCMGQGIVRSDENLALSILREVEEEGVRGRSAEVTLTAPISISNYIMNMKRTHLSGIERRYGLAVTVLGDPLLISPEFRIERAKTRSRPVEASDAVITAESVAASSSPQADAERATEARPADDSPDEKGEGRSRRRRGKRGGQRRRREDADAGGGDNAGQTSDTQTGDSQAGDSQAGDSQAGVPAKDPGSEASGSGEADPNPADERRPRRRRGGRGRSRRQDEGAVTEGAGTEAGDGGEAEQADASPTAPDQPEPAEPTQPEAAAPAVDAAPEVAEPASEAPADTESAEPEIAEPRATVEAAVEPVAEPQPEPVAAAPAEPEPEKPAAPKRRGWWLRS